MLIAALVLAVMWFKGGWVTEGFQSASQSNEQVFLVIESSNPQLDWLGGTKVCGRLGARMASYYDVKDAKRNGLTTFRGQTQLFGWTTRDKSTLYGVLDTNTSGDLNSNSSPSTRGVFCIGERPTYAIGTARGYTIADFNMNGAVSSQSGKTITDINILPESVAQITTLSSSVYNGANQYTIFDVSGVYVQLNIQELVGGEDRDWVKGEYDSMPRTTNRRWYYWDQSYTFNRENDMFYLTLLILNGFNWGDATIQDGGIYIGAPNIVKDDIPKTLLLYGKYPIDYNVFTAFAQRIGLSLTSPNRSFSIQDSIKAITEQEYIAALKKSVDDIYSENLNLFRSNPIGFILSKRDRIKSRLQANLQIMARPWGPPYHFWFLGKDFFQDRTHCKKDKSGGTGNCIEGDGIGDFTKPTTETLPEPPQGSYGVIWKYNSREETLENNTFTNSILQSPNTWKPILRRTGNTIAQNILTTFLNSKANDPAKIMWRPITYRSAPGVTISPTNTAEINKSISYSIYFNFSDPTYTERQIRISSDSPYNLFMSPNFNAVPEFSGRIAPGGKFIIEALPEARANNAANCAVQITPEFLQYIPHHAREYILRWANSRYKRVQSFFTATGAQLSTTTLSTTATQFTARKPILDMVSPDTPADTKRALMNKFAQSYYDLANTPGQPQRRIKQFLDVYNIGDTIFDARFIVSIKGSTLTRDKISTLTGRYQEARNQQMTAADLLELDQQYQSTVKSYYEEEAGNVQGTGTDCGVKARYVRISANTPGRPIQLSQIQVYNNEGDNLAGNAQFSTFSTIKADLFGAAFTMTSPIYDFLGQEITDQLTKQARVDMLNESLSKDKLALTTDGTRQSKSAPNIYKGTYTLTEGGKSLDFIQLDLATDYDIVAVNLIQPSGSTDQYSVILGDYNFKTFTSTVTTGTASFLRSGASGLCASGSLDRFRVARFYTSTSQSLVRDAAGNAAAPDPSQWTVLGFSEDFSVEDCAALTFNTKYNAGFKIPIDQAQGNQLYEPTIQFSKNSEFVPTLDCTNPTTLRNILAEYSLSQTTDSFITRTDVAALTGASAYTFATHRFVPSSITGSVQIGPDRCGVSWDELKVHKSTNAYEATIRRFGNFAMTPDRENWLSPNRIYDAPSSRVYTEATPVGSTITTFPNAIPLTIPLPVRAVLDNAGGACPEKRCSDTDVIERLVVAFNASTNTQRQILRVNKAITVNTARCDFEVVIGDYSSGAAPSNSITSTIAMGTLLDPGTCKYNLISTIGSLGEGNFVTPTTPLLSRIYTYATDYLSQFVSVFTGANQQLSTLAANQIPTSQQTLADYRGGTLAAYGAIKQLDGCPAGEIVANRCTDPQILASFADRFAGVVPGRRLTKILASGTASGTECDFTVETEEVGTNGTPGVAQTRGLRCGMQKIDGVNCAFRLADTYTPKGVFIQGTNLSRADAANACVGASAQLASADQLAYASTLGFAGGPGWVGDRISTVTTTGGINTATATTGVAFCYGARASVPSPTRLGPCMEILPQPNYADMGLQQTTASTIRLLSDVAPALPLTITEQPPVSPADFIQCTDQYARQLMGIGGAAVTAASFSSCTSGGQIFRFERNSGGIFTLPGRPTPSLSLSQTVGTDADCMRTEFLNATGIRSRIVSGKRVSANTCEYRLTPSLSLPFADTYRRIAFYTESGQPRILSSAPGSESATPAVNLYQPSLRTLDNTTLTNLCKLAKSAYNTANDTISATNSVFRKRFGNVSGPIGYIANQDALVISATSADIGPNGNLDIRRFYEPAYFVVVFRKPPTAAVTGDAGSVVYSITRLDAAPAMETVKTSFTWTEPADDIVIPVLASLRDTTGFALRMVRLTNITGDPIQFFRINFRTNSVAFVPPYATVSLTGMDGETPLLEKRVNATSAGVCPTGYIQGIDPTTQFITCTLDQVSSVIPAEDGEFYRYTPNASAICRLGYTLNNGVCELNYNFSEFISLYPGANPSTESPRITLQNGQAIIINFNDYIRINEYLVIGGTPQSSVSWILEGSNNGTSWATISIITRSFTKPLEITPYYTLGSATTEAAPPPQSWVLPTAIMKEQFTNPGHPGRRAWLRFRWLTAAPFVAMSMLRFYTEKGLVPTSSMRLSNPGGSRRNPAEGPDALLANSSSKRWVDYNKQPLLVRIDPLPAEPIVAFRFYIPTVREGVPTSWILEGSADGRSWAPVHEQRTPITMLDQSSPYLRLTSPL